MNKKQAIEHLRKVGLVPPSEYSPQNVAARVFCGDRPRMQRRSIAPLFLRDLGHLAYAKPVTWPPRVEIMNRVLTSFK